MANYIFKSEKLGQYGVRIVIFLWSFDKYQQAPFYSRRGPSIQNLIMNNPNRHYFK